MTHCPSCGDDQYIANGNLRVRKWRPATRPAHEFRAVAPRPPRATAHGRIGSPVAIGRERV